MNLYEIKFSMFYYNVLVAVFKVYVLAFRPLLIRQPIYEGNQLNLIGPLAFKHGRSKTLLTNSDKICPNLCGQDIPVYGVRLKDKCPWHIGRLLFFFNGNCKLV